MTRLRFEVSPSSPPARPRVIHCRPRCDDGLELGKQGPAIPPLESEEEIPNRRACERSSARESGIDCLWLGIVIGNGALFHRGDGGEDGACPRRLAIRSSVRMRQFGV